MKESLFVMKKKYYKHLDIFRAILCIAVLLYHLNMLPGGFLAVCCFFVLSGYLTTKSLLSKETVDLKKHYLSRFKKVYIPLLIVVFATVALVSLQQDVVWVSLKPETTSVLLGYNNFWQINANLDYFARHTSSPFTHLWYMAILLQFEVFYPILFALLKKTKKLNHHLPSIISGVLAVGLTIWFYVYAKQAPISAVYYNTFARVFSLFIGVNVCFIHHSIGKKFLSNEKLSTIIFCFSIALLLVLFFVLRSDSEWFAISMIVTSLISCLVIECAVSIESINNTILEKIFKFISNISYEIYLVQYPVIYLYEILSVNKDEVYAKVLVVSLITIVISVIIHFVLSKTETMKKLKMSLSAVVLFVSLFGGYQFVISQDHTEEMKQLEAELAAHAEEMEKQNVEYEEKLKQENDAWEELLAQLEPDEEAVKQSISRLPVVCLGDSVMLGAAPNLRSKFSNGYVDAKVSRTAYVMPGILKSIKIKGPVVIHAGTNGDAPESVKKEIMKLCGNNDVFWLTVTNDKDVKVNEKLKKFVEKYENAHIIDWQQYSKGHEDWFYGDRIHLREVGKKEYTALIFNSIYDVKLAELENIRDAAITERENQLRQKISFYGNDLLLGVYNQLTTEYMDASFTADKYLNKEMLLTQLSDAVEQNTLNYNVVVVVDTLFDMDAETFRSIKNMCQDKNLYIFTTDIYKDINDDCIYSFAEVLKENPDYYSPDRVRLSEQGNIEMFRIISDLLMNKTE